MSFHLRTAWLLTYTNTYIKTYHLIPNKCSVTLHQSADLTAVIRLISFVSFIFVLAGYICRKDIHLETKEKYIKCLKMQMNNWIAESKWLYMIKLIRFVNGLSDHNKFR